MSANGTPQSNPEVADLNRQSLPGSGSITVTNQPLIPNKDGKKITQKDTKSEKSQNKLKKNGSENK